MGSLSSVWDAVKSVGSVVIRVVKKAYEYATSDSAVAAYDRLERIIEKNQQQINTNKPSDNAPDFFGSAGSNEIDKKIHKQNQELIKHGSDLVESKKITAVQIELSRLRSSADLIDRSMKNIKIHASSLSVHYQNMRNINGLIDDVNTLRYGLKTVISTINYNANLDTAGKKQKKIEGIDIEKNYGAISQVAAYDAFDRTRGLLRDEVTELSEVSSKHIKDIENLKANAASLGGSLGSQIIEFADNNIIPIVKKAESSGLLLKSEVTQLPAAIREQNGSLVFEEGKIKLEELS